MKVSVNAGEVVEYKELSGLEQYWKEITSKFFEQNEFIHYVTIDEYDYYEGYEKIIVDNWGRIGSINIVTIKNADAFHLTKDEITVYLEKCITALDSIASPFYSEPKPGDWSRLQELNAGLGWLYHSTMFLLSIIEKENVLNATEKVTLTGIEESFKEQIEAIAQIMEETAAHNSDHVALADYINYELSGLLVDSKGKIEGIELRG